MSHRVPSQGISVVMDQDFPQEYSFHVSVNFMVSSIDTICFSQGSP